MKIIKMKINNVIQKLILDDSIKNITKFNLFKLEGLELVPNKNSYDKTGFKSRIEFMKKKQIGLPYFFCSAKSFEFNKIKLIFLIPKTNR